jgi:tetratricopeptide (TPR) repeat protein
MCQAGPAYNDSGAECRSRLLESANAIHREQFNVAIDAAQKARSSCSDKTEPLLLLARAQMLDRKFQEAIQSLDQLRAIAPNNIAASVLRGQVLYLDDRDQEAAQAFRNAVNLAPDHAEPRYWLGKFLFETGKAQLAIDEYQAAIRADPKYYRAYDGLGLAYAALGDKEQAIKSFLQAIELTKDNLPGYDDAYGDLAELLLHMGKSPQAFDVAVEAADRNPHRARNFLLAGRAAEQAGKYEASLRWLKRAAELDPEYPDPHLVLAQVYRRLGQTVLAAAEATNFQELSAKAPKVRR